MVPEPDVTTMSRYKNLRLQIVEMAGKTSEVEVKGHNRHGRTFRGSAGKENEEDNSRGFIEDKRRPVEYPLLQRKKGCINLNFTSLKKNEISNEEHKTREFGNVRNNTSVTLTHLSKGKTRSNVSLNERKDAQQDSRNNGYQQQQTITRADTKTPRPPILPREPTSSGLPPKSARFRQKYVLDQIQKAESKQEDGRINQSSYRPPPALNIPTATPLPKKECLLKCEIQGNAVPSPPQHRSKENTRASLFSASLAVFKRRLKASARRFSARLHDDFSSREEEYLIAADPVNQTRSRPTETPRQKQKQPCPPSQDPPVKPRRVRTCLPNHGITVTSAGLKLTQHHVTNDDVTAKRVEKREYDQTTASTTSSSSPQHVLKPSSRCDYSKLLHQNDRHVKAAEIKFHDTLPSVTNAKTYVLETEQNMMVHPKKNPEPIPLTTHNLRLHESLLTMYARRARRLERCRRMANDGTAQEVPKMGDYASPSERIQKWLQGITFPEIEVPDEPSLPCATEVTSRQEVQFLQPCSAENGFDLHQSHNQIIFV